MTDGPDDAPRAQPASPRPRTSLTPPEEFDAAQLAAPLRLVLMRLARRLRRESGTDLTPTLVSALVSVERLGPLTLGELAAAESVRPPGITRTIANLERAGLVTRRPDDRDRRAWRVSITPAGRDALKLSRTRKTAYLAARIDGLDAEERSRLRDALPVLERLLDAER
jgi:DNA-binding MarR family transcriptional regulator